MRQEPFTSVFTRALQGLPCVVVGLDERPGRLPVTAWSRAADDHDLAILDHCRGSVLDIGCGPGRMTAALSQRGVPALGIDVVQGAVDLTRARGAVAVCGDVFGPLPGEGLWQTALLADGNVGIGGDPVALLRRVRDLLGPGGRTVIEVAGPGVPSRTVWAALECAGVRSSRFRWSVVGVDDLPAIAGRSGHRPVDVVRHGTRWCAVLEAEERSGACELLEGVA